MAELDFFSLEGAVLVYEDGVVLQLNEMMGQVYPELNIGDPVPPELLHALEPEVSGAVVAIGDDWLALVMALLCRQGAALRLKLTSLRQSHGSSSHLEFAVRNFIQQASVGKSAIIDKGLAEENPEVAQYLTGMNHQLCRLQKALDLCEPSSVESRGGLLRPVVDFTALYERVCLELAGLQEHLKLRFSWEITGQGRGRPLFVQGDEKVLEKSLLYLFHQGAELSRTVAGERNISFQLTREQGRIRVILSGSWRAVDQKLRFEQSDQLVQDGGLQIAQQLLTGAGGALLYVASGGSIVFHLTLPMAKADTGRVFSPAAMVERPSDYPMSLVVLSDMLPQEVYSPLFID